MILKAKRTVPPMERAAFPKTRVVAAFLSLGIGGMAHGETVHGSVSPSGQAAESESFEDPFLDALRLVNSKAGEQRTLDFGADRGYKTHGGIDLMVPIGTPIHVPADTVVLIGVTKVANDGPGATIGNGLVFFVPDDVQPYFLLLAHLNKRTFDLMDETKIGTVWRRDGEELSIVAYSGSTMSGRHPHLHISTVTKFKYGKDTHSAKKFMERYQRGTLTKFLEKRNFNAIKPPERDHDGRSLADYLDPMRLIVRGMLYVTSRPLSDDEARYLAAEIVEKTTPEIDPEWEVIKADFLRALQGTRIRTSLPPTLARRINPKEPVRGEPEKYELESQDFEW